MPSAPKVWVAVGNWKMVDPEGREYIKVTDFPVPDDCPYSGESMWVIKKGGSDYSGWGLLENMPFFCTEVALGDLIEYAGGSGDIKPKYTGRYIP